MTFILDGSYSTGVLEIFQNFMAGSH